MVNDEIKYIKGNYKKSDINKTEKSGILKDIALYTIKLLLKFIYYVGLEYCKLCIFIFFMILYAPLYMFFGVRIKNKRRYKRGF